MPSEIMLFLPGRYDVSSLMSDLVAEMSTSCPSVSEEFITSLSCSDCSNKLFGGDGGNVIELKDHRLNEDLLIQLNQCEMNLVSAHNSCEGESLQLPGKCKILFLKSSTGVKVRLDKSVKFFRKSLRCRAVVTATSHYFSCHGVWYQLFNNAIIEVQVEDVEDVLYITLEAVCEDISVDVEALTYTGGDYQKIIQLGDRHLDSADRHLDSADRHLDSADRHLNTPLRREDRHLDSADRHLDSADRHLITPSRRQDRHKKSEVKSLQKLKKAISEDTGMDVKCSSCLELKSRGSCHLQRSVSEALVKKYCNLQDIAKSKDGRFYICISCKTNINADKVPTRGLKDYYGLYGFPEGEIALDDDRRGCIINCLFLFTDFISKLKSRIVPNPYQDEVLKPHTTLNRLEHCLLKPVIPFMMIGHCPRGNYLKLKGSVVMISADVTSTLDRILPVKNALIPVSFKRKLEYKGYYSQEYIDRVKVGLYYQFFKTNNHLYENIDLGNLQEFEEELCSVVDDNPDASDSSEQETESIPMSQSSLILDKYGESINTKTVANKLGSMIHDYEQYYNIDQEDDELIVDPEDPSFPDDDREAFEEDNSFLEKLQRITVPPEDQDNCLLVSELEELFRHWKKKSPLHHDLHFCFLVKQLAHFVNQKQSLVGLHSGVEELQQLIDSAVVEIEDAIKETSERLKSTDKCNHDSDDPRGQLLDEMLKASSNRDASQYARDQVKQIERNIQDLITVAPGVGGKFQSWGKDIYLEEKLFPNLFPYGIGGYLSTNLLKSSKIGFANYCKNRVLSVQAKFREDADYLFFLTIVKEQIQMRSSQRTYLRKASKVPSLSASSLSQTNLDMLQKSNSLYQQLRNLRGSAPYFQAINKNLMAFLRQKGAPTIFVTLSSAEFAWDDLALKIFETVSNKPSTLEFIRSQSQTWRNKLLHDNVVQSTIHFSKRVEKIIAHLTKNPMFEYNGVKYSVVAHFVRTEFQARGAPHVHMLLYLEGENGEEPPSLLAYTLDGVSSLEEICNSIASFSEGLILGSASEAHCEYHDQSSADCELCLSIEEDVGKYQIHRHSFTCYKKKKRIVITEDQGHGKDDGKKKGVAIELKSCRFNFPKNPCDKNEFLVGFPEDTDKTVLKKAKADYDKIRKFLWRLTHDDDFKKSERWQQFIQMSFYQYLYAVGMFDTVDWTETEAQRRARDRYLTALRLIFPT